MYTILRLRAHGHRENISWFCIESKRTAHAYYYLATLFDNYDNSFIALFDKHEMLKNNQKPKKRGKNGKS
jgi:hypothetical protein